MLSLKPNIEQLRARRNILGLVKALVHKDPTVRERAVRALDSLDGALLEWASERVPKRSLAKVLTERSLRDLKLPRKVEQVTRELLAALRNPDWRVRVQAARALKGLAEALSRNGIGHLILREFPKSRSGSSPSTTRSGPRYIRLSDDGPWIEGVIDELAPLLHKRNSPDPRSRALYAALLGELGAREQWKGVTRRHDLRYKVSAKLLYRVFCHDPEPYVQMIAQKALWMAEGTWSSVAGSSPSPLESLLTEMALVDRDMSVSHRHSQKKEMRPRRKQKEAETPGLKGFEQRQPTERTVQHVHCE